MGTFGGPRSYTAWIQRQPAIEGQLPRPEQTSSPVHAPNPSAAKRCSDRPRSSAGRSPRWHSDRREAVMRNELLRGNVPDFLRNLKAVRLEAVDGQGNMHSPLASSCPTIWRSVTRRIFFACR